jgi:hypothetical protein
MTRTDVMASSRPQRAAAGSKRNGPLRGGLRGLVALPVVLLMAGALLLPSAALAASGTSKEGLSGYSKEAEPKSGTSPAKETKPAAKETAPETAAATPESAKAGTLPFTGFDLRWTVGVGIMLIGAGFSIVVVQRRQRRDRG